MHALNSLLNGMKLVKDELGWTGMISVTWILFVIVILVGSIIVDKLL